MTKGSILISRGIPSQSVTGRRTGAVVAYTAVDYYTLTVDRSDCCKAGVEALRLHVVVYPDVNELVKK